MSKLTEAKTNLNYHIKFKLTDAGKIYLQREHIRLYKDLGATNIPEYKLPKVDKDGYCNMQLWEFIGYFGNAMQFPTLHAPVECDVIIEVEKDDNK